ncbi:MAG: glycosyltransferase family 4 protein [Burkholderiaceae bacterium]
MTQPLHLINPMLQVSGAELHAVHVHRILAEYGDVTLWGHRRTPDALRKLAPVRILDPLRLRFPRSGVLVVLGAYFPWFLRPWFFMTRPARTILLYNLHDPQDLQATRHLISRSGRRPIDMIYASEVLEREAGIPGFVENSPIDLASFTPGTKRVHRPNRFVVGRCSRDVDFKFAETDAEVFRTLAGRGVTVRLVGGTCLRPLLGSLPNVELWPEIAQSAVPEFLAGLDCFVYRTSSGMQEAYGRVIAEAMACGVPVVVESRVGASKHIEHGVNGFIANTDAEVIAAVERLRDDPALRTSISAAARTTISQAHTPENTRAMINFYFRPAESTRNGLRLAA